MTIFAEIQAKERGQVAEGIFRLDRMSTGGQLD
jgi:hypothetical protein